MVRRRAPPVRTAPTSDSPTDAIGPIDVFLASLSDELRGPLSAVLLWADVAASVQPGDPTHEVALETIKKAAREQSRVIDDVLELAMACRGELAVEPARVDAAQIVGNVVSELASRALTKQVAIVSEQPQECPVDADPRRLDQVIRTLVAAAIDHAPRAGTVIVSLTRGVRGVELRISDSGGRHERGASIGLALARLLVERQAGSLEAATNNRGGTTFTVRFPLAPANRDGEE
jgi:signal transduction histidine kinase